MNAEITRFFEVLESYEHLLHAETQAIATKDVDLVEEILAKKDQCMDDLLTSKENLGSDPREDAKINSLIDKVIELQQRNYSIFSSLVEDQRNKKSGKSNNSSPKKYNKLRQTYLDKDKSRISNLWD